MQNGRFIRAAPPYTASQFNWYSTERDFLPARYWGEIQFNFGSLGLQDSGVQMSGFVTRPTDILSFRYHFTFKIGIINFKADFLFEPTFTEPLWDIGLLMQASGFGDLTATYRTVFLAIHPQELINQTMVHPLTFAVTGSFKPVLPTWRLFGVSYHEEP